MRGDRYLELKALQARPLEQKVADAHKSIEQALAKGKATIAWSGGKDSTVLLDMVRQHKRDIIVVWNNTGVEFPETYRFIKEIREQWGLNLIIAKPKVTFWWCVERFGWPLLGKDVRRSSTLGYQPTMSKRKRKAASVANISAYCCDYLKDKPMRCVCREQGIEVQLVGCLVEESRQRLFVWFRLGALYQRQKDKMWVAWPLAGWTDEDVWGYHRLYNLPYCKLYDLGHKRNGCWPCGMDIGFDRNHLSRLRESHPKLWHHLIVDRGLGQVLLAIKLALRDDQLDFFQRDRIEGILAQRPCYFDNLEGL